MPLAYTPVNPDAANAALYSAARSNAITGTFPPPAQAPFNVLPVPFVDPNWIATLQAIADGILGTVGFQQGGQDDQAAAANSVAAGGVFVDAAGYPSFSFTPQVAKTYVVNVDLSAFITGVVGIIFFQLTVDGVAPGGQPANSMRIVANELTSHKRLSFRVPIAFATAAAHTLKIQWRTTGGTGNTDTSDFRCFTVVG